jgi:myo-inositol-1(or 4)-monophosphatase
MLETVSKLVVECAQAEILPLFRDSDFSIKCDGSIVTQADTAMQARMQEGLARHWPQIALLGEEMPAAEQARQFAQSSEGVWVLDPLDGTSNFAAGIPFFSVSLALIRDDAVQLGVVYDPVRNEVFAAVKGGGASLNGRALRAPNARLPLDKSIGLIDFKRLQGPLAQRLAGQPPYASQRSFGSVALDWCWIAAGRGHVYLHGKQKLWDFAAGWLILEEAGGRSCTLEGEPVFTMELAPRSAVAASDPEMFQAWCRWLGVHVVDE